jgi:hypothetical protein
MYSILCLAISTAKLQKKDETFGYFNRICYFCRKINNNGGQFTRILVVLPVRHGGVLLVPDEEGGTECVPFGLLILVLLTSRHQDDGAARHPDLGILGAGQRHLPLYGEGE